MFVEGNACETTCGEFLEALLLCEVDLFRRGLVSREEHRARLLNGLRAINLFLTQNLTDSFCDPTTLQVNVSENEII